MSWRLARDLFALWVLSNLHPDVTPAGSAAIIVSGAAIGLAIASVEDRLRRRR